MANGSGALSVAEFIDAWQLNEDSQETIFSFDPEVCQQVLEEFAPKNAEGRDVNGKFITFALSVNKAGRNKGKGKGKSIIQFVNDWGLNEDAQNALFMLSPTGMTELLHSFAPQNAEGRDVNGKFISFASSILKASWKGKGQGKTQGPSFGQKGLPLGSKGSTLMRPSVTVAEVAWAPQGKSVLGKGKGAVAPWQSGKSASKGAPHAWQSGGSTSGFGALGFAAPWQSGKSAPVSAAPVSKGWSAPAFTSASGKGKKGTSLSVLEIISEWGLNQDSQDTLFNLPPESAASVLNEFAPKNAEGRDVNGKFIQFARGIGNSTKGMGKRSVAEFVVEWSLNEDAQAALFNCNPDAMRDTVMSFAPKSAEGRDVNGKFIMFATSVAKRCGGKGGQGKNHFSPY